MMRPPIASVISSVTLGMLLIATSTMVVGCGENGSIQDKIKRIPNIPAIKKKEQEDKKRNQTKTNNGNKGNHLTNKLPSFLEGNKTKETKEDNRPIQEKLKDMGAAIEYDTAYVDFNGLKYPIIASHTTINNRKIGFSRMIDGSKLPTKNYVFSRHKFVAIFEENATLEHIKNHYGYLQNIGVIFNIDSQRLIYKNGAVEYNTEHNNSHTSLECYTNDLGIMTIEVYEKEVIIGTIQMRCNSDGLLQYITDSTQFNKEIDNELSIGINGIANIYAIRVMAKVGVDAEQKEPPPVPPQELLDKLDPQSSDSSNKNEDGNKQPFPALP